MQTARRRAAAELRHHAVDGRPVRRLAVRGHRDGRRRTLAPQHGHRALRAPTGSGAHRREPPRRRVVRVPARSARYEPPSSPGRPRRAAPCSDAPRRILGRDAGRVVEDDRPQAGLAGRRSTTTPPPPDCSLLARELSTRRSATGPTHRRTSRRAIGCAFVVIPPGDVDALLETWASRHGHAVLDAPGHGRPGRRGDRPARRSGPASPSGCPIWTAPASSSCPASSAGSCATGHGLRSRPCPARGARDRETALRRRLQQLGVGPTSNVPSRPICSCPNR